MVFDSFVVFFIAVTPFLYKIYDYLPKKIPNATISLFGLEIDSNGLKMFPLTSGFFQLK